MTGENLIPLGLKRFRKEFKLSQKDMATMLGITENAYQNYEYGKSSPTAAAILKIAKKYNVTADYLIGLNDKPRPTTFDEHEVKAAFEFRDKWKSALQVALAQGLMPRQTVTA